MDGIGRVEDPRGLVGRLVSHVQSIAHEPMIGTAVNCSWGGRHPSEQRELCLLCSNSLGAMAQHRHGHHEGGSNGHEAASRKPWLMLMLERKYPTLWFGHVQLGVTLMVFFVALPGQSFFLGTLTPYLIAELGVSSQVVSFYFFLAFSGAAVWLQFVGRLIDKHGTVSKPRICDESARVNAAGCCGLLRAAGCRDTRLRTTCALASPRSDTHAHAHAHMQTQTRAHTRRVEW